MKNSEFDALILKTIKTIEEYNDTKFKPRIRTIVSFLKGAERSPFYSYFTEHKDICGKAVVSTKAVEEACLRLCNRNLIAKRIGKGKAAFFETQELESFTKQCTQEEQKLIIEIEKYIKNKYTFIHSSNKKNRYAFYDSRIKYSDGIEYAWMWFTFKDMELIFRYKLSVADNDKAAYEGNQIVANEFHKKTIINLIDLVLQRNP